MLCCRMKGKSKDGNQDRLELANIAVEGLAKALMHEGRWHSNANMGMQDAQIVQVPFLTLSLAVAKQSHDQQVSRVKA